jgi:hypothetical protein
MTRADFYRRLYDPKNFTANKTMKLKLKRCPFCNSHDLSMEIGSLTYWVKCYECHALGPLGKAREDAALLWNGKHKHTNPSALVANRKSNHHEMKEIEI